MSQTSPEEKKPSETATPELTPEQLEAARAILANESPSPSTPEAPAADNQEDAEITGNEEQIEAPADNQDDTAGNTLTPAALAQNLPATDNQIEADATGDGEQAEAPADNQDDTAGNVLSPAALAQDLPAIDPATVTSILAMVDAAINSAFYMSNTKRVAALVAALKIPVSDDKSFNHIYLNSDRDLNAEAGRSARKNGVVPSEVTKSQIIAEAQKRYHAKHGKNAIINEEYLV